MKRLLVLLLTACVLLPIGARAEKYTSLPAVFVVVFRRLHKGGRNRPGAGEKRPQERVWEVDARDVRWQ